ncbi:MAG: hypothetical protein EBZ77_10310, partial [Chitinophagia bacterium]|nr:hypothetical protein [Chitinophagia bacterium]
MSSKKKKGAQPAQENGTRPAMPATAEAPKHQAAKKEDKVPAPIGPDFFEAAGKYNVLIMLGLLLAVAGMVFINYLSGERPYCFTDIASDTINLSYPYMVNYANYIAEHGLPMWSFHAGMGQSIFPFFLREPFELLLFLAGKNSILGGLVYLEVMKIVLSGLCFYWFLRLLRVSPFAAVFGSLCFSFSGFMIMGSAWYGFTYEALCLALFLVAYELLYQKGNWYLIPVVVALIALSMPFNLYLYGLFVLAYSVFRNWLSLEGEVKQPWKLGRVYLQLAGFGIVGLLLAGPFLIENVVQILESPRGTGNNSLAGKLAAQPMFELVSKFELGTNLLRFFSNDILGTSVQFKGWPAMNGILESGSFYCGLPCLLLMPQVFPFLERKMRLSFAIFLTLWLLPLVFPYFRHAFWLFSGDYYRAYAFFVAIVFILYAVMALDFILRERKLNMVVLGVTAGILLLLLNYPWFDDPETVNGTIKGFDSVFILGYGALLFFLARPTGGVAMRNALLGMLVLELCYLSGITTNGWAAYEGDSKQKTGYTDYTQDAIKYIKERDKSFYRIDKSYGSSMAIFNSINDALVQDYYGTSSYNP